MFHRNHDDPGDDLTWGRSGWGDLARRVRQSGRDDLDPAPTRASDRAKVVRALRAAMAVGAGLAICVAMPPWGWWPLAIAGIALWLHVLEGEPRRGRFVLGWIVGVTWFGPSTLWMCGLTQPGYLLGVLLGVGAAGRGGRRSCHPPTGRRLVALPAAIVLFEWFHTHAPFGGVPLSMLGDDPDQRAAAARGTDSAARLLVGQRSRCSAPLYLASPQRTLEAGRGGGGRCRRAGHRRAPWPIGDPVGRVTIAAVQGGGPQGTRYDAGQEPAVFERHLEATREIPDDADLDLVLWPENAINVEGPSAPPVA